MHFCDDCICFVSFHINKEVKYELLQPLTFLTKAKTYTCNSCDASPVCFLQIGKNCSERFLSYLQTFNVNEMRFNFTKILWMWLTQFLSYVISRFCPHFLGHPVDWYTRSVYVLHVDNVTHFDRLLLPTSVPRDYNCPRSSVPNPT